MAVDSANINRTAGAASWAIHVEPRHPGEDGGSYRWRPQRASTGREGGVPAFNHAAVSMPSHRKKWRVGYYQSRQKSSEFALKKQ
jgi:hypothetical protein